MEVERREKEYNQLLTTLLAIRRQPVKKQRTEQIQHPAISKANVQEITRAGKNKKLSPKKKILQQKDRARTVLAGEGEGKESWYVPEPPQLNLRATGSERLEERLNGLESNIGECGDEVAKVKELQNYLMEQVLTVFERLNHMQRTMPIVPTKPTKSIATEETIPSSAVLEPNSLTPKKQDMSPSRWSGFSPTKDNPQLSDAFAKILEHETVLSELIGLTRDLSGRVETLIR